MLVGLGILAALWAAAALQAAFMAIPFRPETGLGHYLLPVASFVPFLLLVWLAIHLLRHRDQYAALLLPEPTTEVFPIGARETYLITLSLIGLYLVVAAIPDLVRWAAETLVAGLQDAETLPFDPASSNYVTAPLAPSIAALTAAVVQTIIGVSLVWFRRPITARLLREPAAARPGLACPSCGHPSHVTDYVGGEAPALCSKCKAPLPGMGT